MECRLLLYQEWDILKISLSQTPFIKLRLFSQSLLSSHIVSSFHLADGLWWFSAPSFLKKFFCRDAHLSFYRFRNYLSFFPMNYFLGFNQTPYHAADLVRFDFLLSFFFYSLLLGLFRNLLNLFSLLIYFRLRVPKKKIVEKFRGTKYNAKNLWYTLLISILTPIFYN